MSYWPNMPEDQHVEMLGKEVIVQNPNFPAARWQARAIGIAMDPSIIIEYSDGHRMTLPLAWAKLAPPPVPNYIAELDELRERSIAWANYEFDFMEDCFTLDHTYMTPKARGRLLKELMEDLDALG